jgi:hypothetical protein
MSPEPTLFDLPPQPRDWKPKPDVRRSLVEVLAELPGPPVDDEQLARIRRFNAPKPEVVRYGSQTLDSIGFLADRILGDA